MEATRLIDPAYWSSGSSSAPGVSDAASVMAGDPVGLVWFQTSGTTGKPRWIGLSREALLLSAAVVNRHLKVSAESCWGLALPLHHVGGFGVVARAFESGSDLAVFKGKWDTSRFMEWLKASRVSHLSLVPTQVHDLVSSEVLAPADLEVVVVGGGVLSPASGRAARELGWPVLPSYGMTEAGSQIATAGLPQLMEPYGTGPLPVLPHFAVRTDDHGRIEISGQAVFSAELVDEAGKWVFRPRESEWYRTGDLGALDDGMLRISGRADTQVKILGELVDPVAIERLLAVEELVVVAVVDARNGHRLVGAIEDDSVLERVKTVIQAHNETAPGFRRISDIRVMPLMPRSELGKVRRSELGRMIEEEAI